MLTDVQGFLVGHHTLGEAGTGCTVIVCPNQTVAGVHVSGGWPGSRDLPILEPTSESPGIDAIAFSGRSVYGLGVADGVIQWVQENRKTLPDASPFVPQVPGAVINDLTVGDTSRYPAREHGYLAAESAGTQFERGSVGAGTGGSVGWLRREQARVKGGIGSASVTFGKRGVVGALAVVNSFGIVLDEQAQILAGPRTPDGGYFDPVDAARENPWFPRSEPDGQTHTTLVAVATNAQLTKTECAVVARMAQAGMASAIRPVFAPPDGDVIIVASSGDEGASDAAIGTLASHVVAASIRDAVRRSNDL